MIKKSEVIIFVWQPYLISVRTPTCGTTGLQAPETEGTSSNTTSSRERSKCWKSVAWWLIPGIIYTHICLSVSNPPLCRQVSKLRSTAEHSYKIDHRRRYPLSVTLVLVCFSIVASDGETAPPRLSFYCCPPQLTNDRCSFSFHPISENRWSHKKFGNGTTLCHLCLFVFRQPDIFQFVEE